MTVTVNSSNYEQAFSVHQEELGLSDSSNFLVRDFRVNSGIVILRTIICTNKNNSKESDVKPNEYHTTQVLVVYDNKQTTASHTHLPTHPHSLSHTHSSSSSLPSPPPTTAFIKIKMNVQQHQTQAQPTTGTVPMWRSKLGTNYTKEFMDKNEKRLMDELNSIRNLPDNRYCADCGTNGTVWASVNLGVFLCMTCGAHHRSLGTHVSLPKGCTGNVSVVLSTTIECCMARPNRSDIEIVLLIP